MQNEINTATVLPELDLRSIELDGVDTRDYPDFCDAFICMRGTASFCQIY